MTEKVTGIRQDMPPPGGYGTLNYKRVPARTFFNGYSLFGGYLGITAAGIYLYYLNCKAVQARELEMHCASLAIYPMLLAERDRSYLKQLRKNRDEEKQLMAHVEGWKVGTWYGEPIYHTQKSDTLNDPKYAEYYVHATYKEYARRADLALWS